MRNNIFLYYLDYEVQTLFGLDDPRQIRYEDVYKCAEKITKIAILLCYGKLILPASNYLESDLGFNLINSLDLSKYTDDVLFNLVSSSYNLSELIEKKRIEHGDNIDRIGYHYLDVADVDKGIVLPGTLTKRRNSASIDICKAWLSDKGRKRLGEEIYRKFPGMYKAGELDQLIGDIPEQLGGRAFIGRYITSLFVKVPEGNKKFENMINSFITREYIRSFLDEFDATCVTDIPLFNAETILPTEPKYQHLSYQKYKQILKDSVYKGDTAWNYVVHCNPEKLIVFKESDCWKRIMEPSQSELFSLIGEVNMNQEKKVTIGIITALPKEFAAIKKIIEPVEESWDKSRNRGDRYIIGKLKSADDKEHHVALGLCGEGNNLAAVRCSNLLNHFPDIKAIIMCGIAGGVPNVEDASSHVRLGDIVVATNIIQYDYGKVKADCFEEKSIPTKCSLMMQKAIDRIKVDEFEDIYLYRDLIDQYANGHFKKPSSSTDIIYDEKERIIPHPEDLSRSIYPKVHYGCIASANQVVKNSLVREKLKADHKALAIEMEGSGIADASTNDSVSFIVIRGICDYCDTHKNDAWQNYAAMVAAAYTCNVIQYLPSLE